MYVIQYVGNYVMAPYVCNTFKVSENLHSIFAILAGRIALLYNGNFVYFKKISVSVVSTKQQN